MSSMKKSEVIRLAEGCRWAELRTLVERDPSAAQERDRFGMIPLHWACTDPSTPQDVLMLLLKAYPAGARLLNSGKMLPLHIAIKAQASIEWLQALLANYPEAAVALTPAHEDVVTLAKKYKLPSVSVHLLEEMRDHVQKTGYRSGSHTTDEDVEGNEHTSSSSPRFTRVHAEYDEFNRPDSMLQTTMSRLDMARSNSTASARTYDSFSSEQHMSLHMTPMEIDDLPPASANYGISASYQYNRRPTVTLPPRWTNAPNCHICSVKFGTFKRCHHCRNCGQSICTDHSAKSKLKLPHFGLTTRQRVCVMCYDALTNPSMAPVAVVEQPMLAASQRGGIPLGSSRGGLNPIRVLTSQPSLPYAYQQPPPVPSQPTLVSQRSYGSIPQQSLPPSSQHLNKDSVIQDMNLQVQMLQQQVNRLMEEKQHAEALLMRQTGSSDKGKLSDEAVADTSHQPLQPEPEVLHHGRPSWEVQPARETSLTDHDLVRETYSRDTYSDVNYDFGRDSRFTLDDRDTFFDKYLTPKAGVAPPSFVIHEIATEEDEEEQVHGATDEHEASGVTPEENDTDDGLLQEVDTLVTLGLTMQQKGSASGAVAAFERAVELLPNDPLLLAYLGKAYYADEDLDRAVLAISKSLDLEPSAANSTLLGKILFEKGDHDKAIEAYQKSLEIQKRMG
ncbi:Aste57867_13959 [Aphanomyces stellatus]|uniref:Aste57867_13959 protein n=1 Tax=Aphanomyces stellatus TaxID=120398 RepID=A0A485KZH3_9STRA|nr:hypothetical protein As57867_013908 [Aphanomyces stellatus]VFT90789.1 Aste57867_13959 [Aphanomyces stellatus]